MGKEDVNEMYFSVGAQKVLRGRSPAVRRTGSFLLSARAVLPASSSFRRAVRLHPAWPPQDSVVKKKEKFSEKEKAP